jgi:DNA-binding LacI/PurR family transcriptional regulator
MSKGVKFPEQISIIGTDNFDVADALGITSIEQPLVEIGKKAFEIAEKFADTGKYSYKSESFKSRIIVRNT